MRGLSRAHSRTRGNGPAGRVSRRLPTATCAAAARGSAAAAPRQPAHPRHENRSALRPQSRSSPEQTLRHRTTPPQPQAQAQADGRRHAHASSLLPLLDGKKPPARSGSPPKRIVKSSARSSAPTRARPHSPSARRAPSRTSCRQPRAAARADLGRRAADPMHPVLGARVAHDLTPGVRSLRDHSRPPHDSPLTLREKKRLIRLRL